MLMAIQSLLVDIYVRSVWKANNIKIELQFITNNKMHNVN